MSALDRRASYLVIGEIQKTQASKTKLAQDLLVRNPFASRELGLSLRNLLSGQLVHHPMQFRSRVLEITSHRLIAPSSTKNADSCHGGRAQKTLLRAPRLSRLLRHLSTPLWKRNIADLQFECAVGIPEFRELKRHRR